jgi:hypothetical protein
MGMTHDVNNSRTGKHGAATELFQFMAFLRVETHNRKSRYFFSYHAMLDDL